MNLKRDLLTSFSMLSIFFAFELIPAATTLTPIVTFSTEISTVDILGQVATVTLNKKDTFTCDTHFVSLNASCAIDGIQEVSLAEAMSDSVAEAACTVGSRTKCTMQPLASSSV